jgi:hypothetical protein
VINSLFIFSRQPELGSYWENVLEYAVHDYNHIRPHGSLKGLTPHEAYLNIPMPVSNNDFINARMQRIAQNRNFNCHLDG